MARSVMSERARLEVLRSYGILDSMPEEAFDNITCLAAEICSTPMALITLVDEARQWFKSRVGIELRETAREHAFCAHALESPEALVVGDTHLDARFSANPLVTGAPNIRFYAGVPLISREGAPLGTLCVLDRVTRALDERHMILLARLARQVETELELRRSLVALRRATVPGVDFRRGLGDRPDGTNGAPAQREKAALVELLVHDMKSPLMSILVNATVLSESVDARAREAASDIEMAAASLQRLILNLLDIGRAEHGRLFPLLGPVDLNALVDETARAMTPRAALKRQRLCVTRDAEAAPVPLDRDLMRRVLENLVDNCLKYSPSGSEVRLNVGRRAGCALFSVADEGPGVPESERTAIFEPFTRCAMNDEHTRTSHGLGLAFCKLAVEAHGGQISVTDNEPHGARFTVELPVQPLRFSSRGST